MRGFEKISFEQFKNDIEDDIKLYNSYILPKRSTSKSAGYDFFLIKDVTIKPNEIVKIPTGYKSYYQSDEALLLIIRSSLGFKYNLRLTNQIGLIDSDFYNNKKNEGHMIVSLQNQGKETVTLKQGEAYVQGVFINYLKTDDDNATGIRDNWSALKDKDGIDER